MKHFERYGCEMVAFVAIIAILVIQLVNRVGDSDNRPAAVDSVTDEYPEDTAPNIDIPVPAPVKAINDPTIQVPKQRPSRQYLSNTTRHNANGDYGEGYEDGYQHGYEAGIAGYGNGEGYDDCYGGTSAQYRSGHEDGYNDGYSDGLAEYEEAQERERIRQRSIFGRRPVRPF